MFFSSKLIAGKGEMSLSWGHGFLATSADIANKLLQSQFYMTFSITEIILFLTRDPRSQKQEGFPTVKAVKSPSVASFHVAEGILTSSAVLTLTRDVTELLQVLLFVIAKHFVKNSTPRTNTVQLPPCSGIRT